MRMGESIRADMGGALSTSSAVGQYPDRDLARDTGFKSRESGMGIIGRLIRHFENLISWYRATLDHEETWRRSKLDPYPKWDGEIVSELKRRPSDQ
jgi:hypothetical protein